ncbi:tRNA (adenosine(37)-N6)-threonylcarbamoyltransferase complex ATPase subunit type 1 TsaE [uncultured Roseibium sp.]|uniref:tRNA (adenosine(37)-N6)-threonylcarbamoyltransferase complex ATPase subunit type 1 TsaE n=1 Tax=uncultured Roseibium sp. TaxID=1936171 RepID=UPI00262761ED|nr:tRNA (adenosine(37)-N6)-threonylcarbamoyltransferase complex ATPase subunit type 1 TsaE [uncultured Roseibium sp.]
MADHQLRSIPDFFLELTIADEANTQRLANDLAVVLGTGDVVCLSGDLGAGKSTLARALVRSLANDPELEVPSPTFTLVQTYEFDRFDLSHFDLYRLEEAEELEELGLDDLLETGAALIEWPEKAGELLPEKALWIQITQPDEAEDKRVFRFHASDPSWQDRIRETHEIRAFLEQSSFPGAERRFLAGDASLRTFETVTTNDSSAVLMRWPFHQNTLAQSVSNYMERVHLAQDCRSVLAIGTELRDRGFRAPRVYKAEPEKGLVLAEDLGRDTIVMNGAPVSERYYAAVEVLARMHGETWPRSIPVEGNRTYQVPGYSSEALITEASLFLDWYVPEKTSRAIDDAVRASFEGLWRKTLRSISSAQLGWVLRDFHSPNLLWQRDASGTDRIGLIDFQDTVFGPVAYDVASLLLDARTDISQDLESALFDAYVSLRENQSQGFDKVGFSAAYSVLAAQRISKIIGIFVRLARRDGKPAYLSHLPRMLGYLDRVLDRPNLSELKDWYNGFRH